MKPIEQSTALVYDHGLFQSVSHALAKKFDRVLYYTPCEKAFATLNDYIVGDGFDNIEKCDDIWAVKDEVDCWCFPDIQHSGLQLELESQGRNVWGSRAADSLEINRQKFHKVLQEVGLPVPKYQVIKGLTNLRMFLKDKTDRYIKISKYRGTCETFHFRDYDLDSVWLDSMAVKLGPAQDLMTFMVFEPIDTPIEVGGDTYCVDGQWPALMLHGDEDKDRGYLGAVTAYDDMPKELRAIMEAFSPLLAKDRYRNQWSMETRDGRFTDATCRGGLPSTLSQVKTWENFPEIVYAGSQGELVEPIHTDTFSVECILTIKKKVDEWRKIRVEPEVLEAIGFACCCEIDGAICFPASSETDGAVGWIRAGCDTMQGAIDNMHELAAMLPEGLTADTDSLIGLLSKIHDGEKEGIEFTNDKVPEPESAIAK